MRKRIWSEEKEKYLLENYATSTFMDIAKATGCSLSMIKKMVLKLGLKKNRVLSINRKITKRPEQQKWTDSDVEYLRNNYNCKLMCDLAIDLKRTESSIATKMRNLGLTKTKRLWSTPLDKWINKDGYCKLISEYKGIKVPSIFECYYCKKEFISEPDHIKRSVIVSCGCLKSLNKFDYNSRDKTDIIISQEYFNNLINNAKRRQYKFEITLEYIIDLMIAQDFKCSLSGKNLIYGYTKTTNTYSLDRIDNENGYIEGNVQWIHKDINRMKWAYDQNYFIELCTNIADKHKGNK